MAYKLLFITLLILSSCKENSKSELNLDLQSWEKISIFNLGQSKVLNKREYPQGIQPYKFFANKPLVSKIISKLSNLELDQSSSSINFNDSSHFSIFIEENSKKTLVDFWSDQTESFVKIQSNKIKRAGKIPVKLFEEFKSDLLNLNNLKINWPLNLDSILYLKSKKALSVKQVDELKDILNNLKNPIMLEANIYNLDKAKKFDVGVYLNENLQEGFEVNFGQNKEYLYFGRPELVGNKIRIWNSISHEVIEAETDNWDDLKKLENLLK